MVLRVIWGCIALLAAFSSVSAQSPDSLCIFNEWGHESLAKGEYRQARVCFWRALESGASLRSGMEYARSLAGYAQCLSMSDFRAADSLYTRASEIAGAEAGDSPEYAEILQGLAEVRILRQEFDGVEAMLDRVAAIRRRRGQRSVAYADALSMQGWYYAMRADFARSEQAFDRAAGIASAIAPDSYDFAKILHKAFFLHFNKQDKAAADSCCRRAIAIYEKTASAADRRLIEIKGNQAVSYIPGRIREAERIIAGLLPVIERNYGKEDYTYSTLVMTLASIYAFDGRTEQALPLFEESATILEQLFGKRHEAYYNLLNNRAMIYMRTERFDRAEALLLESLEIRKELTGTENPAYVKALNNLAVMYLNRGSYERAAELFEQLADLSGRLLDEASKSHLLALTNLGLSRMRTGQHEAALAAAEKCERLMARHALAGNRDFAELHAVNLLTALYGGKDDPELGSEIEASAATLKALFGERNTNYLNAINGLSAWYLRAGDYERALEYATQDAEATARYRGTQTSAYMKALSNKAAACYQMHRWQEAETTLAECLGTARRLAAENLPFMSSREREEYWQAVRQPLDNISGFVMLARRYGYDSPELCGLLYDRSLLFKSLLLNFSSDIRQSVLESGDEALIAIWRQLKKLKESRTSDAAKIEELDKQLSLRSVPYRDRRRDFSATWQDVRDRLEDDEAAVEITAVTGDKFEPYYIGLVLRSGDKTPQRVMLGSEELVATALQNRYTATNALFTPLEKHLRGVKRIYLSASGLANKVSFAGMGGRRSYLIDRYSICNLLSTKDIAAAKQRRPLSGTGDVVLFGGADFGLSVAELDGTDELPALRRGQGFDYLPGSKKEVTDIGGMLACEGWRSTVYTDKQAAESRFKALSSASPEILHISTHGYYFPPAEAVPQTGLPFKTADDPMLRSGLLFSGANEAWTGKTTNRSADDGILTGREIALMDLSHTRLVVLSACRTALGDNDYSEGIYGLQRAFRIAGAQALLVTLHEIPDRETTQFMTAFYERLMKGAGIRAAFDAAMRAMRKRYPSTPEVWAGFVLIE